jgi:hypothetical protein
MQDVAKILKTNAQIEERIAILCRKSEDVEKRLRTLEVSLARNQWMERIVWLLLAAGISAAFTFK